MSQIQRPISDITNTFGGGTYASLADESDSTYAYSNDSGTPVHEVLMTDKSGTPPGPGTCTVTIRQAKSNDASAPSSGGGAATYDIEVYEGATQRAVASGLTPGEGAWADYSSLTFDASVITNWADVRLRLTAHPAGGGPNSRGVAWCRADIFIPDPVGSRAPVLQDGHVDTLQEQDEDNAEQIRVPLGILTLAPQVPFKFIDTAIDAVDDLLELENAAPDIAGTLLTTLLAVVASPAPDGFMEDHLEDLDVDVVQNTLILAEVPRPFIPLVLDQEDDLEDCDVDVVQNILILAEVPRPFIPLVLDQEDDPEEQDPDVVQNSIILAVPETMGIKPPIIGGIADDELEDLDVDIVWNAPVLVVPSDPFIPLVENQDEEPEEPYTGYICGGFQDLGELPVQTPLFVYEESEPEEEPVEPIVNTLLLTYAPPEVPFAPLIFVEDEDLDEDDVGYSWSGYLDTGAIPFVPLVSAEDEDLDEDDTSYTITGYRPSPFVPFTFIEDEDLDEDEVGYVQAGYLELTFETPFTPLILDQESDIEDEETVLLASPPLVEVEIRYRSPILQEEHEDIEDELHDIIVNIRALYAGPVVNPFIPVIIEQETDVEDEFGDWVWPIQYLTVEFSTRTPFIQDFEGYEVDEEPVEPIINRLPLTYVPPPPFLPVIVEQEDELEDEFGDWVQISRYLTVSFNTRTPFIQDFEGYEISEEPVEPIINRLPLTYVPPVKPFSPLIIDQQDEWDEEPTVEWARFQYEEVIVPQLRVPFIQDFEGYELVEEPVEPIINHVPLTYVPSPFNPLVMHQEDEWEDYPTDDPQNVTLTLRAWYIQHLFFWYRSRR